MLNNWAKATDGTGNSVRVLLVDYRKAFDLIAWSLNLAQQNSPTAHPNLYHKLAY
jgi:hypothetical protein